MWIEDQLNALQDAMDQAKYRRHFERYQAVRLYLSGYTMTETGRIIGRRRETVGTYVSAYKEAGIAGLSLGHSPGKTAKLTPEQQAELVEILTNQTPADVGFTARYNWTLALITEHVKHKWGVSYSLRGMSMMLKRLGLSYTRPTYTLKKADPEKQREFTEETFPALKKTDQ